MDSSRRRWVETARIPGVTPTDPAHRQPRGSKRAVNQQRLAIVLGAGGLEATCARQKRAHQHLVDGHGRRQRVPGQSGSPHRSREISTPAARFIAASANRISDSSAGNGLVSPAGRPTNTTLTPDRSVCCSRRYASRIRRRARFRFTAVPSRRLVANATRRPRGPGSQRATKLCLSSRLPCLNSRWISVARWIPVRRGSASAPGDVRATRGSDG